jgi:hypothetical protein
MTKSNERVVTKGIKGATVHGTTTKLWKPEIPFCQKCKMTRHLTVNCRRVWPNQRGHLIAKKKGNLSECVAMLCATQVEGQGFLCMPKRPAE